MAAIPRSGVFPSWVGSRACGVRAAVRGPADFGSEASGSHPFVVGECPLR